VQGARRTNPNGQDTNAVKVMMTNVVAMATQPEALV
jgi:hypothetical protein